MKEVMTLFWSLGLVSVVIILAWIIITLAIAVWCGNEGVSKGYNRNVCQLVGLLLGFVGMFIIHFISPRKTFAGDELGKLSTIQDAERRIKEQEVQEGKRWKCNYCGEANLIYLEKCVCGRKRPLSKSINIEAEEKWICKRCGNENSLNIFICKCGMKKSENENYVKDNTQNNNENSLKNIELIKGYKELLDIGAITKEEFDKKKEELL